MRMYFSQFTCWPDGGSHIERFPLVFVHKQDNIAERVFGNRSQKTSKSICKQNNNLTYYIKFLIHRREEKGAGGPLLQRSRLETLQVILKSPFSLIFTPSIV